MIKTLLYNILFWYTTLKKSISVHAVSIHSIITTNKAFMYQALRQYSLTHYECTISLKGLKTVAGEYCISAKLENENGHFILSERTPVELKHQTLVLFCFQNHVNGGGVRGWDGEAEYSVSSTRTWSVIQWYGQNENKQRGGLYLHVPKCYFLFGTD